MNLRKSRKKAPVVGFTSGVFDLFHVGHVNLLRTASGLCDTLIVAVSTDECAQYKNKTPVIPFEERVRVVESCKYVSIVVPQYNLDKINHWKRIKFDILFVGDDWFEDTNWKSYEASLEKVGAKVVYLPYTKGTSSTLINEILKEKRAMLEG